MYVLAIAMDKQVSVRMSKPETQVSASLQATPQVYTAFTQIRNRAIQSILQTGTSGATVHRCNIN